MTFAVGCRHYRLGQNRFGILMTALVGTSFETPDFLYCTDNELVFIFNLCGNNSK